MRYRVEYFQPKEFICPCCKQGNPAAALVYSLDELRRAWSLPIRVNSGWRCKRHNAEVGGVENSRHLLGLAADIAPTDDTLIGPFQNLVSNLFGRREGWELKLYPRFIHIAVPRGNESVTWDGSLLSVVVRSL